MRHRNKINSLGRKAAHRKATMSSLATALILNKRINTTIAKAKALRVYVEPLITKSKDDSTHSRRVVFSYLRNKYAVSELFREISLKVADRPGGYTRILKTGFRKGDGAEMCFIELVDYNTHMLQTEEDTQQKRTRRGRRRGKKADDAAASEEPGLKTNEKVAGEPEVTEDAELPAEAPKAEAETKEQPDAVTESKTEPDEVVDKEEPVGEKKQPAEPKTSASDQDDAKPAETKNEKKPEDKSEEQK